MKQAIVIFAALGILVAAASASAGGRNEDSIQGPPYDVATVMRILSSEALYQQGYLQREIDKNGDGISDETGVKIYAGALRNYQDADADGLDDSTGGQLPLGLRNRLVDRNGDGIVDGTSESVGQYINRARTEARLRYEQQEGDQLEAMTQSQDQTQTQTREQTQDRTQEHSATQSGASSPQSSKPSSSAPRRTRSGSKNTR